MARRSLLTLVLLLLGLSAHAQTDSPQPSGPELLFSRIRGLFDFDLPDLDPPGTMKLTVHPHISDFVRRDYLRTEVGLRWAINDSFELNPEVSTYVTHGLGDDTDDGYGVGAMRLGAKYVVREWPWKNYEASWALNLEHPTGAPPVDMTDGHDHYRPSLNFQHHWDSNRKLTTFFGAELDLLRDAGVAGTFGTNQPHDDNVAFTGGAIYDLGQLKWTLAATYATTAGLGSGTDHFFYLRPSVLWYVPKKYTFNSKTQWIVGLGVRSAWGPDGFDFGVTTRVRAEITFRQVMDTVRDRVLPRRARAN